MNKRRYPFGNGVLIVFSILLCIVLGVFLVWNRRDEQETILLLQQEEVKDQESDSASSEEDADLETNDPVSADENMEDADGDEKTNSSDSALQNSSDDVSGTTNIKQSETETSAVEGISFRGDSFGSEEDKAKNGFGICLSKILTENNQDLTVADYTMDVAGTLSQMRLAGVAQADLDAYLSKHKEEAGDNELRITETKIRDLTQEDLVRVDQTYIPVICMGYYGGWGNDLDELCEQQQKILDTYQQQEKYLILGIYPTGFSDKEAYNEKMSSHWGEHYISLDSVLIHSASSAEGKKETAEAVYDKLMELGYLS